MWRTAAFAVVAMTAWHGAAGAQEINFDIKVPGYTEADAMVAIDIFRRNCRPLGAEFWSDVTSVEVTISEEYAPYRQAHLWKNSIELRLKYSDDPQVGPSFASGTGILAGHNLYYYLGAGTDPGFFASKRSSQYLCGLAFSEKGEDIFVSVPQLKFVDR